MIDVQSLTLGEIAKVEELSGQGIGVIADTASPRGLLLAALAFVWKRRTGDPKFTWNQACSLTMTEAQDILGITIDGEPDPDEPAPQPAAPSEAPAVADEIHYTEPQPTQYVEPPAPKAQTFSA